MKARRPFTAVCLLLSAACASAPEETQDALPTASDPELWDVVPGALTPLATPCSFTSGVATVVLADGEAALIARSASDSALLVNGFRCGSAVTGSTKRVVITGSAGANTVVIDFSNGLFTSGSSSGAGFSIDLQGGTDRVGVRGTSAADSFVLGADGLAVNKDNYKDFEFTEVEQLIIALGGGNDTFSGAGGLGTGIASSRDVVVYGGAGNDTFLQGTVPTANEELHGGADKDTVSYADRLVAVSVSVSSAADADDGEVGATEGDDLRDDIEVVTGTRYGDTLTASASGVTLQGGLGDDTLTGGNGNDSLLGEDGDDSLTGGAGNDTLSGGNGDDQLSGGADADSLNGDAGADTLNEGASASGADTLAGGAGTDVLTYASRGTAVRIDLSGATLSGEAGENDVIRTDVENAIGTSESDVLIGNTASNELTGGDGDDTLSGGAGDDVFIATGTTATDGNDSVSGEGGSDRLDYSSRTVALTINLLLGQAGLTAGGESDVIANDVENADGGGGSDSITGSAGPNVLYGAGGNDTLDGGAGDDILDGGAGTNVIDCGLGDGDVLVSGSGNQCEL